MTAGHLAWSMPVVDISPGPHTIFINPETSMADLAAALDRIRDSAPGGWTIVFRPGRHYIEFRILGALLAGLPGLHNIITGEDGHVLVQRKQIHPELNYPTISIEKARHWDTIGLNFDGSAFQAVRYMEAGGTAESRVRCVGHTITNCHHAAIKIRGWYEAPFAPSSFIDVEGCLIQGGTIDRATPEFAEGVYIGTGWPHEWADATHDIRVRFNTFVGSTVGGHMSDIVEAKTGTRRIEVTDNVGSDWLLAEGSDGSDGRKPTSVPVGFISMHYANTPPPPGWDGPVDCLVARNQFSELRQGAGSIRPVILVGRHGITVDDNDGRGFDAEALVTVDTNYKAGGFGDQPIVIRRNTADKAVVSNRDRHGFNPNVVTEDNRVTELPPEPPAPPTEPPATEQSPWKKLLAALAALIAAIAALLAGTGGQGPGPEPTTSTTVEVTTSTTSPDDPNEALRSLDNPAGVDGIAADENLTAAEVEDRGLTWPAWTEPVAQVDNGPSPQGQFRLIFTASHFRYDDPIIFPGQPGAAHLHMFFGNTLVDADSTADTLLNTGGSSGQAGALNRSAYWAPAMLDGDRIVMPNVVTLYYKSYRPAEVRRLPQGVRMLAGNIVGDDGTPGDSFQAGERLSWGCYNPDLGIAQRLTNTIPGTGSTPECPNGWDIQATVQFPQCFAVNDDGTPVLSSDDFRSHTLMLYDFTGNYGRQNDPCPPSHPYRTPQISYLMRYANPPGDGEASWRLSSDHGDGPAGGSLHADWFGAWNDAAQDLWLDGCFRNAPRNCSLGQTGRNELGRRFAPITGRHLSAQLYRGPQHLTPGVTP